VVYGGVVRDSGPKLERFHRRRRDHFRRGDHALTLKPNLSLRASQIAPYQFRSIVQPEGVCLCDRDTQKHQNYKSVFHLLLPPSCASASGRA